MNANTKKQLNELIARAKIDAANDSRRKNRGRPAKGIDPEEAEKVGYMRKRGVSLRSIHTMLREKGLTSYEKYNTFKAAWIYHKAEA